MKEVAPEKAVGFMRTKFNSNQIYFNEVQMIFVSKKGRDQVYPYVECPHVHVCVCAHVASPLYLLHSADLSPTIISVERLQQIISFLFLCQAFAKFLLFLTNTTWREEIDLV